MFYDACDSTYKSSEYGTIVKVSSSTTTNYTAYDSTNNCYKTRANGDWGCLPINALNNADNYKITAYFKTPSSNHLYRGGFGLVKSGTTSPFWSFRIQGDNKFVYQKYNVASEVAIATNIDASGYFHRMELIKQGSTITCKLYAQDDTTVLGTKTITDTIDNPVMGLYLCCGSSYGCYVKEIKAEAL